LQPPEGQGIRQSSSFSGVFEIRLLFGAENTLFLWGSLGCLRPLGNDSVVTPVNPRGLPVVTKVRAGTFTLGETDYTTKMIHFFSPPQDFVTLFGVEVIEKKGARKRPEVILLSVFM
jgi:hypothetical protein